MLKISIYVMLLIYWTNLSLQPITTEDTIAVMIILMWQLQLLKKINQVIKIKALSYTIKITTVPLIKGMLLSTPTKPDYCPT